LILDPDDNTVEIYGKRGEYALYEPGGELQFSLFGIDASIPVSRIFEGITL